MTMHRRPVGRARLLAALGALVTLAGTVLPWWTVGGHAGELPASSGNAFESTGIIVFVAALATIALVTLPYATDRPMQADRWQAYALVAVVGSAAFAYRIFDLAMLRAFSFAEPVEALTRAPGVWVTTIGLIVIARATYDTYREPHYR
ncbi:MAG TPA: hypothetical protein VEX41_10155 [Candidatus Eisenbacteria bacterium]|nr:hypothetical protein [Candidatus Eisenbacteria bacterium]